MKIVVNILIVINLFMPRLCLSATQDDIRTLCKNSIDSTVLVGLQLVKSKDFKTEDFNRFINMQETDERLKEFLKRKIVKIIMEKNNSKLNNYINSGSAVLDCTNDLGKL